MTRYDDGVPDPYSLAERYRRLRHLAGIRREDRRRRKEAKPKKKRKHRPIIDRMTDVIYRNGKREVESATGVTATALKKALDISASGGYRRFAYADAPLPQRKAGIRHAEWEIRRAELAAERQAANDVA